MIITIRIDMIKYTGDDNLVCKGVCVRYKAPLNNYMNGQKRCQVCQLFVIWNQLRCPCCGYRLRTRPRKISFNRKVMKTRKVLLRANAASYK